MALETSTITRALVVTVSLLLVGGVAGALTVVEDRSGDNLEAGASTTSSLPGGSGAGDGEDAQGDGQDAPGSSSAGSSAGPGAPGTSGEGSGGASVGPAATSSPPKDGTYTYKVEGDGGDEEDDLEVTVVTTSKANGEVRQEIDGQFGAGSGTVRVVWKADGLSWEGISDEEGESDCEFKPLVRYLPQPLAAGSSWSYDSTCSFTYEQQPITVRIIGSAKVSGSKRTTVGDTPVDVWVIERSNTYEISIGEVKSKAEMTELEHWAPATGLVVYKKATVKSEEGEETETLSLTSLDPKT